MDPSFVNHRIVIGASTPICGIAMCLGSPNRTAVVVRAKRLTVLDMDFGYAESAFTGDQAEMPIRTDSSVAMPVRASTVILFVRCDTAGITSIIGS